MYSASCFQQMGDHDRALAAGQHALALAEALGDFDLQVTGRLILGGLYMFMGDFRRAIVLFRWQVEHLPGELLQECFGIMGPPAVTSRVNLTRCLTELGAFAEGIASGEEAIRIAEAVNHPYSLIYAYDRVGALYLQKGALPQALHTLERGLALCGAENLPVLCNSLDAQLGFAYAQGGRVAEALPRLQQAVEQAASRGWLGPGRLHMLSQAYLLAGHPEEAMPLAQRALELSRVRKRRGGEAWALWLLGEVAAHRDPPEVEQADNCYQQALTLADERGMRPLQAHSHLGLGILYAKTGRREQARIELATAIELYRALDMTFWLPQAEVALTQTGGAE